MMRKHLPNFAKKCARGLPKFMLNLSTKRVKTLPKD